MRRSERKAEPFAPDVFVVWAVGLVFSAGCWVLVARLLGWL